MNPWRAIGLYPADSPEYWREEPMEELIKKLKKIEKSDSTCKGDDYDEAVMTANISDFDKGWLKCTMSQLGECLSSSSPDYAWELIKAAEEIS